MKLCVISNSHVVSLTHGWEVVGKSYPDVDVTYFASHGGTLTCLEPSIDQETGEAKLTATRRGVQSVLALSSGGLTEIDLSKYDAFLLYGIRLKFPLIEQGSSRAVIQQTFLDSVTESINYMTMLKIRSISKSAKIFVGHEPLPARQMAPQIAYPPLETKLIPYDRAFKAIKKVIVKSDSTLLAQPEQTIDENLTTKTEFSKGSVRLDGQAGRVLGEHQGIDIMHMNAEFGRIFWETHLPTILEMSDPKQ